VRIYRALTGHTLRCGCLVGVYETYEGSTVRIVDAVGDGCPQHRESQALGPADSAHVSGDGSSVSSATDDGERGMTVIRFSS
jgi:hypothetical protein